MATTVSLEEKIKKIIIKTVKNHWDQHKTVCLLSILGSKLKAEIPDNNKVLSKGLRDYLQQNALVDVVHHPNIEQKVGAVPLKTDLSDDITKLFKQQKQIESTQTRLFYKQEFWNAFVNKLEDGQVRIVMPDVDGELVIKDVAEDQLKEQTGSYQIKSTDIFPSGLDTKIFENADIMRKKIIDWVESQGLRREVFLRKADRTNSRGHNDKVTLLLSAFEGFDDDDLARVSIPLDILSKLSSSR